MIRAAHIIPAALAALYLMAYGVERGVFVADIDRIDYGTLIRKDCLYLTWDGIERITAEDKKSCRWFVKFSWR